VSGETSELRLYLRRLLDARPEAPGAPRGAHELPPDFGRFEFKQYLGKGAMGGVFLAYRPDLERYSAVKLLWCDGQHGQDESQLSEARALLVQALWLQARIQSSEHPNVVLVYDVHETDDGVPVVEMQYVRGKTLLELSDERERHGVDETIGILMQILRALEDRYDRGFVHGDLSLRNVMCTDDERTIKVLDFAGERGQGTPCFAAPEQRDGTRATPEMDVFAVGALAYTLLTGDRLDVEFQGLSSKQRLRIPASLRSVITRCLEVAPAERYHSPRDVIAAIQRSQRRAWRIHLARTACSSVLVVFTLMMGWLFLRIDLLQREVEAVASEEVQALCDTLKERRLGVDDYFFVYERGLVARHHPWRPELVGRPLRPDQPEYAVVQRLWDAAESGLGLRAYLWEKPSLVGWLPERTGMPKIGWAVYVPEHDLIVGSGLYVDDVLKWTCLLAGARMALRRLAVRRAGAGHFAPGSVENSRRST
jgi:hypothetical protein